MVATETLPSGLRLVTESMPHVRSVSIGVWLARGSRHESDAQAGIAHFVEHMVFKGTERRSTRDIAQVVDAVGGHLDAFTAKEYTGYYLKVLDEHLPIAVDLLSDMLLRPAMPPEEVVREQGVVLEEIKMVEDAPDDLVHEVFTAQFWARHPLGRTILGTPDTVRSFTSERLHAFFREAYRAPNLVIAVAGHIEHDRVRDLVAEAFAELPTGAAPLPGGPPAISSGFVVRHKDIEQSHICLGTPAYPLAHEARYALHVLNVVLGGSISSRLFQHIREERGLAYAVWSTLTPYTDTGTIEVYAGCASDKVDEVIDLTLAELRALRETSVPADELQRARDHLKGSLMLSLENTSSRMSQLAREELYFDRHFTLDELVAGIGHVTADDVQRAAVDLFGEGAPVAAVVGPSPDAELPADRLRV